MPPKGKPKAKRAKREDEHEKDEESNDDTPALDDKAIRGYLAHNEAKLSELRNEIHQMHSRKKHRKESRKSRSSSSESRSSRKSSTGSTSSKSSSKTSKKSRAVYKDIEVERWRPSKWPTNKALLRTQMDITANTIHSHSPPGHVTANVEFIRELVDAVGDGCKKKVLQGIIGRHIVITQTKAVSHSDYAEVEKQMKSKMLGKSSRRWSEAKAKALAACKETKTKKSGSFRGQPKHGKQQQQQQRGNNNSERGTGNGAKRGGAKN